jgi:hypothetical protein
MSRMQAASTLKGNRKRKDSDHELNGGDAGRRCERRRRARTALPRRSLLARERRRRRRTVNRLPRKGMGHRATPPAHAAAAEASQQATRRLCRRISKYFY